MGALVVAAGIVGWKLVADRPPDPAVSPEDASAERRPGSPPVLPSTPGRRAGDGSGLPQGPGASEVGAGGAAPSADPGGSGATGSGPAAAEVRGSGDPGDASSDATGSPAVGASGSPPDAAASAAGARDGAATSGPSADELVRVIESALAQERWDSAELELARLRSVAGSDPRAEVLARRLADGRRIADLRARVPRAIERNELETAATLIADLEALRRGDEQAAVWREQVERLRREQDAPAREHGAVRSLVTEFHRAFSDLDLDRFSGLFVDPAATRREYERAFRDIASQSIALVGEPEIEISGSAATVRLRDHRRQVMKIGRTFESDFDVVLTLEEANGRWKILSAQTKLRQ
jgi:hypothetical protein